MRVTHHTFLNLFGQTDKKLKFFLLPTLKSFHGILGNDTLKDLNAVIYTKINLMTIMDKVKVRIKQLESHSVNAININTDHMTKSQVESIENIVRKFPSLLSQPNEKLTYSTAVIGEIRTNTDTPVYSKFYPYPASLRDEVTKQVKELLDNNIVVPSRSPYNSPVWIVPKKSNSSGEKQFRLVIDYRKLNSVTISDRYPIPEINEVLAQLGKSKYFSVLDLKSGFHQIPLKPSDREKTAFSINGGKYEFTRLPFGLKNAPSIFQRAVDDILHKYIGKICYVYIDDIIIFSENEQDHALHVDKILQTLCEANMKIQIDKCHFFKKEVEFLGFIVSHNGLTTNPNKVQAIVDFPIPKTLKELRSFLGLSGYYRRFVRDYAKLAKPLTTMLRGEEGRISKNKSNKTPISLSTEAIEAFNKLKKSLISKDLLLAYPDFKKSFELTTDASEYAIGAVLSQNERPVMFISRALSKSEEHFAVNEKEMLAIIWALNSFRNYLYGTAHVKIFTDHQPLTYAMSNKNNNAKMKRWKSILEEYDYEIKYKPGKSNVVADALSRVPQASQINSLTASQHSDQSSAHNLIPSVESPINVFKNQILLLIGENTKYEFKIPFPTYHRHIFTQPSYSTDQLISIFKKVLNPSVINGLYTQESIMGKVQEFYPLHYQSFRIRFTQTKVTDLTNLTDQCEEILKEHNRAHRSCKENKIQLLYKFYFPKMNARISEIIKQCRICKEQKYERHPNKPKIQETPIPQFPGQIVHFDIYSTDSKLILTGIDKFSKYAQTQIIKSRAIHDVMEPLRKLIFSFGVPKQVIFDNEKSFHSATIYFMLKDQLGIEIFTTPPYSSSVNGQVERFHSTLSEIMRCLKATRHRMTFDQLLDCAVYEYNYSIHSVTNKRPIETFFGRIVSTNPDQYEAARQENIEKLRIKQHKDVENHNKSRQEVKEYSPGETIYVKINRRLGTKLSPRFKKETVKENRSTTILTKSGKIIHKNNIRN